VKEEPSDFPGLIQSLLDSNKKVSRDAADRLIAKARKEPELIGHLERLLSEVPPSESWPVAYVLGNAAQPSVACLQVLRKTLDSPDPDLRWGAVSLLARLASGDARIPVIFVDLLTTGSSTQRRMAVYGLRDAKLPDASRMVPPLVAAIKDADPLVRVAAVLSLQLAPEIPGDVPDSLLDLLSQDPDTRVRCAAASTLGKAEISSRKITDALAAVAAAAEPRLRKAAQAALESIKKRPAIALREDDGGPSVD
jgi:HEAT repeat protein